MNAFILRPETGNSRSAATRRRSGVVLMTVLVTMLTICLVVGLVSAFSVRSMRLARRTLDVRRAFVVAEAGLGFGVMRTRQLLLDGGVSGFYANYGEIGTPPSPDSEYELRLVVRPVSHSSSSGTTVAEEGSIEVISGARNLESGVSCALRVTISAIGEKMSDYAVFFDGDLEANVGSKGSDLTFRGKIHTNSDLYVSKWVTFDRNVTCNGVFYHGRKTQRGRKNWRDTASGNMVFFRFGDDNVLSPSSKDSQNLVNTWDGERFIDEEIGNDWISQSSLYYGNSIQSGQNGVPKLAPPISVEDDEHTLIEPPKNPSDPGYHAATETQKFANRAALTLHVFSDGSYTLKDNVHGNYIVERATTAEAIDANQAEPYQPGYWKGWDGEKTRYIPGYWYGTFNEKPSWGENWEWVPQYTPPKNEDDTWWMNNHPGISVSGNGWGSDNLFTALALSSYSWADSQKDEWDTSINRAGTPGGSKGSFNPGYARHKIYAKNPKTSAYILKKKGTGIQTVRADPTDDAGIRKKGNMFLDQRQHFMMAPADIYLDQFLSVPAVKSALNDAPGGEAGIDKILYIEMDEPDMLIGERFKVSQDENGVWQQERYPSGGNDYTKGGTFHPVPCVRIRNGTDPGMDLSIVTDRAVYVEGDFNTKVVGYDSDGTELYRNTLIAGDRITQMSKSWQDAWMIPCPGNSTLQNAYWSTSGGQGTIRPDSWTYPLGKAERKAVTTTINSVLMMGIYPSVPATDDTPDTGYSGGLENIIRFVENWTGQVSYFNGSIICLWNTRDDDKWRKPGANDKVYIAPQRSWAYTKMMPPGLPGFFAVREATWERVAWSSVDWGDEEGGGGEGGGEEGGG